MHTRPDERHRATSFFELYHYMKELEEKYGTIAEIHVSTDEDDSRNALLCITATGFCKVHRDARCNTFSSRQVPYTQLHRVCEILLEMFYDIDEAIEGKCPTCLAVAWRHN